jgi:hypothetical protein
VISSYNLLCTMYKIFLLKNKSPGFIYTFKPVFHHCQSFPRKPCIRIHCVSHFYSLFTKAHCSTIPHQLKLFLTCVLLSFNCNTYLCILLKEIQRPNIYTSHVKHQPNFACNSFFHHRCYVSFQLCPYLFNYQTILHEDYIL